MNALQKPAQHIDTDELRKRADCREIAFDLFGHGGTTAGSARRYSNPKVHQSTPSFTVYPDHYYDFSTDERGDVFGLVMLVTGCDFKAALELVAGRYGYPSINQTFKPYALPKPAALPQPSAPAQSWQAVAADLIDRSVACLWNDHPETRACLNYLRQVRGLTDETIKAARIGYCPKWTETDYLDTDGKPAKLGPGLILPWVNNGQVWHLHIRCRVGNLATALMRAPDRFKGQIAPKYLSFKGGSANGAVYGLATLRPDAPILIVEGEFDQLLASQTLGQGWGVITLGSASARLHPDTIAALTAAPGVYLLTDNDAAGQGARAKLAGALPDARLFTVNIPDGQGKDVTDYMVIYGGDLPQLLSAAQPYERPPAPIIDLGKYLPDSWRAALNEYLPQSVAPVIELMYEAQRAGLLAQDTGVSRSDLQKIADGLGRQTSAKTIRSGLTEAAKRGLLTAIAQGDGQSIGRPETRYALPAPDMLPDILLQTAEPIIVAREFPDERATVAPIRAAYIELLLEVDGQIDPERDEPSPEARQIAAELTERYSELLKEQPGYLEKMDRAALEIKRLGYRLKDYKSSPLPSDWTYKNSREYRALHLHSAALSGNLPAQPTAIDIKRVVGVAKSTAAGLYKLAAIQPEPRFADRQVRTADELGAIRPTYSKETGGFPALIQVAGKDYGFNSPLGRSEARIAIESGRPVTVKYRQASKLNIVSLAQPAAAALQVEVSAAVLIDKAKRAIREADRAASELKADYSMDTLSIRQAVIKLAGVIKVFPPEADEPTRAALQAQTAALTGLVRQAWAAVAQTGEKEAVAQPADLVWSVRWLMKLTALVTPWARHDGRLIDRETGELQPATLPVMLAILRDQALPEAVMQPSFIDTPAFENEADENRAVLAVARRVEGKRLKAAYELAALFGLKMGTAALDGFDPAPEKRQKKRVKFLAPDFDYSDEPKPLDRDFMPDWYAAADDFDTIEIDQETPAAVEPVTVKRSMWRGPEAPKPLTELQRNLRAAFGDI